MTSVEYVSHMGDDLTVVNAARVSMAKHKEVFDHKDEKLIRYLVKHEHWTPLSHPQITLRETVPIFVARQRFKHMVGFTYNEVSRRYVDSDPEFHYPSEWRSRPEGSIKQGSGSPIQHSLHASDKYAIFIEKAKQLYHDLLEMGAAPEQARMVLPQSMLTSYYVTGSLAAFARAFRQRIDAHAQAEIQEMAKQWDAIISSLYPVSWAALTKGKY